jgi:hypothetical protein
MVYLPVAAAEQSKACTVFARSEAVIVGSNPTQGTDVWCVCVILCLCCLCLGRGLATSWSPVQGVLPSVNDQETEKSALCSKSGSKLPNGSNEEEKNGLLNEVIGNSYYKASNDTVISKQWVWKDSERFSRYLKSGAILACLYGLRKAKKTSVRLAGIPAVNRNTHPSNTSGNIASWATWNRIACSRMVSVSVEMSICPGQLGSVSVWWMAASLSFPLLA